MYCVLLCSGEEHGDRALGLIGDRGEKGGNHYQLFDLTGNI